MTKKISLNVLIVLFIQSIIFIAIVIYAGVVRRIISDGTYGVFLTVFILGFVVSISYMLFRFGKFEFSILVSSIGLFLMVSYVVLVVGFWMGEMSLKLPASPAISPVPTKTAPR
jgi:hypothetical protein